MNEQFFKENLQKYLDGEIDPQIKAEMDRYIAGNPLAGLTIEKENQLNNLIHHHIHRIEAPYALRESVVESLNAKKSSFPNLVWMKNFLRPVGIACLALLLVSTLWVRNSNSFPFFSSSITRHMDCLKGIYTMEIESDDPQEIAKWFEGKLGFSVNPPDLSRQGAKLIGARLCHLNGRNVAFITYKYRQKQVSAFIIDVKKAEIPRGASKQDYDNHTLYSKSQNGYQSVLCLNNQVEGIGCIYVSDIPQQELMELIL